MSFSTLVCNHSGDAPIEAPQFTVVPERKHRGHMRIVIILGAVVGSICVLVTIGFLVLLYVRKNAPKFSDVASM